MSSKLQEPLVPKAAEQSEDEEEKELKAKAAKKPNRTRSVGNFNFQPPVEETTLDPITPGVWCIIASQFAFYGATAMFLPALFKHAQAQGWPDAPKVFANALVAAGSVTLISSFVVGGFSDTFGEKRAYQLCFVLAILSDVLISFSPDPFLFVLAWAALKAASEGLRGAKNAYLCKHAPTRFNFASNLALNSGIVGSTITPVAGALLLHTFGEVEGFRMIGFSAVGMHALLLAFVTISMPEPTGTTPSFTDLCNRITGKGKKKALTFRPRCVECREVLTQDEQQVYEKLCKKHFDHFEDLHKGEESGASYPTFRNKVLGQMCVSVICFQFAINITVMALFQPLVVNEFNWGADDIAYVQSFMALLGFLVTSFFSVLAKNGTITAQQQNKVGQACFLIAVLLFVIPPLNQLRLVAANIFSFFAQIIFSGPMHVVFGQILTSDHITSIQLSILGAQIAVGQALGCYAAPYLLPYAGTPLFCVAIVPVIVGIVLMNHLVITYDPDGRVVVAQAKKKLREASRNKRRQSCPSWL